MWTLYDEPLDRLVALVATQPTEQGLRDEGERILKAFLTQAWSLQHDLCTLEETRGGTDSCRPRY